MENARANAAHVAHGIYIGSHHAASDASFLDTQCITYIVKCDTESPIVNDTHDMYVIRDLLDEDYSSHLNARDASLVVQCVDRMLVCVTKVERAARAIHERVKRGERVLVHCYAGVNRSALTIAWYLRRYHAMPYEDAVKLIVEANTTRNMPALVNRTYLYMLKNMAGDSPASRE